MIGEHIKLLYITRIESIERTMLQTQTERLRNKKRVKLGALTPQAQATPFVQYTRTSHSNLYYMP